MLGSNVVVTFASRMHGQLGASTHACTLRQSPDTDTYQMQMCIAKQLAVKRELKSYSIWYFIIIMQQRSICT